MSDAIEFDVPLPSQTLHPNARAHWATRAAAAKRYGDVVRLSLREACGAGIPRWERATLALHFVFGVRRRRDDDNLAGWFKAGRDAIVRAGLIPDDDAEHLELGAITIGVEGQPPGARGRVRVRLERRG